MRGADLKVRPGGLDPPAGSLTQSGADLRSPLLPEDNAHSAARVRDGPPRAWGAKRGGVGRMNRAERLASAIRSQVADVRSGGRGGDRRCSNGDIPRRRRLPRPRLRLMLQWASTRAPSGRGSAARRRNCTRPCKLPSMTTTCDPPTPPPTAPGHLTGRSRWRESGSGEVGQAITAAGYGPRRPSPLVAWRSHR